VTQVIASSMPLCRTKPDKELLFIPTRVSDSH
jgi:hypothetical protein